MSGQVVRLDDAAHQSSEALLPWFVNGSLDGDEHAQVQQHVQDCLRCQREAEWLREVQCAYQATDMAPDAMDAFNRLRPNLEARQQWTFPSLGRAIRKLLQQTQGWPRWTLAAQFAVIVALGVVALAPVDTEKT